MNTHTMRLQARPFQQIKEGTKNIEIRLNDEKRQKLSIGDTVRFELLTNTDEVIVAEVTSLTTFDSFKDLFGSYKPESYGGVSPDEYEGMYFYYSPEDERKYGVLAISLKMLSI